MAMCSIKKVEKVLIKRGGEVEEGLVRTLMRFTRKIYGKRNNIRRLTAFKTFALVNIRSLKISNKKQFESSHHQALVSLVPAPFNLPFLSFSLSLYKTHLRPAHPASSPISIFG